MGTTHNRTSPLSRVDGIDRLEGLRAAQDTPPTQTAAKNRGTTLEAFNLDLYLVKISQHPFTFGKGLQSRLLYIW